jgi:NAD(P)-dependent dehydrogenase (short-subunit alcohol dehydrogenase family)
LSRPDYFPGSIPLKNLNASKKMMQSLGNGISALVVGARGGIGAAIVAALEADPAVERIYAAARLPAAHDCAKVFPLQMDVTDEQSVAAAASECASAGELELVIVASGLLHESSRVQPEKSWDALDPDVMERVFAVNCIGPATVARHFLPLLPRGRRSVFAALSARVGSISDNKLGGWYTYRASKAALNMLIRTLAIELARKNPSALCLALHPGTVDTNLSAPFRSGVSRGQLFSRERAASQLLAVIDSAAASQSGQLLSWDGQEIQP